MAGKKDKVKDSERFSIITKNLSVCYMCGSHDGVQLHEIFFGPNRARSKEDGMVVPLCSLCHKDSPRAVHRNATTDSALKKVGEKYWILANCDSDDTAEKGREKFIKRFNRNYLELEEIEHVLQEVRNGRQE